MLIQLSIAQNGDVLAPDGFWNNCVIRILLATVNGIVAVLHLVYSSSSFALFISVAIAYHQNVLVQSELATDATI